MKPFRFPLQAVLTLRMNQENKALETFARALAVFERLAAQVRTLQGEIDGVLGQRRDLLRHAAPARDVQQLQQALRGLQQNLRGYQAEMEKAKAVMDEKAQALAEARQKREVVEKLEEKQMASYEARFARAEQKSLDEFATLKTVGNLALKWK